MQYVSLKDIVKVNSRSQNSIVQNTLPSEIGTDYTEQIKLQDDLFFLRTDYRFLHQTRIEAQQNERKFVVTFSLKGKGRYTNRDDRQVIPFQEGFTTISLLDQTEGFRDFETKEISQVRLILTENFLMRNLKENVQEKYLFNNSSHLNLVKFAPTSVTSQCLLKEMLECPFHGELASLYLQGKALELLFWEMHSSEQSTTKMLLDTYDINKIYQAKQLLLGSLRSPPSIAQLSRAVHLNELKLKTGFKQVFHRSPYQLLLQYKMYQAKEMLESGELSINEIAHRLGYKYANNFSGAFFKTFGVLPKALKNRF